MSERKIDPKFNIHSSYRKMNLVNPYRYDSGGSSGGSFLLDTYPALVAYSLRRLSSTYNGALIRVRRSSDDAEMDIGFDANGDLDVSALLSFVGSNNGLVTTIYDQAGLGFDFTQTNPSLQGAITVNGVMGTIDGFPIITRVTSLTTYNSNFTPNDGGLKGVFFVGDISGQTTIIGSNGTPTDIMYLLLDNNTGTAVNYNVSLYNERLNGSTWTYANRNEAYDALYGKRNLISNVADFNFKDNTLALADDGWGMAQFQELIIFNGDSNQIEKENSINSYYSIY